MEYTYQLSTGAPMYAQPAKRKISLDYVHWLEMDK